MIEPFSLFNNLLSCNKAMSHDLCRSHIFLITDVSTILMDR